MSDDFPTVVEQLIRKAPAEWLTSACEALRSVPASTIAEVVLQRLPGTRNDNLAYLMTLAVRLAAGQMSWEALSWTLQTTSVAYHRWQTDQHVELLWAGPSPADRISARRIDQALYDLIDSANREILLVTFAAAKIERLSSHLWKAAERGVRIRLVLEFEQPSEGQLSLDALKAFPATLIEAAEIYYWPLERRERNLAGRPGKLHAKVAIIDDVALISSANLTDDAFHRNLEVGVMLKDPEFLGGLRGYLESLICEATLCRLSDQFG